MSRFILSRVIGVIKSRILEGTATRKLCSKPPERDTAGVLTYLSSAIHQSITEFASKTDRGILEDTLKQRKQTSPDPKDFFHKYKEYQGLVKNSIKLQAEKEKKQDGADLTKLNKLKSENDKRMKALRDSLYFQILQFPNTIDPETPVDNDKIIYEHGEIPQNVKVKPISDLLPVEASPTSYYLQGSAAQLEQELLWSCVQLFENANFVPVTSTGFCKPVLLEGCGLNYKDENSVLQIDESLFSDDTWESRMVKLVGGASLASSLGLFSNITVDRTFLPLRYVSYGRNYQPFKNTRLQSVFDSPQTTQVHFLIVADKRSKEVEHEAVRDLMTDWFKELDQYFRIRNVCIPNLDNVQSSCLKFEMFSPSLNKHVTVGEICKYGEHLSQRLHMKFYKNKNLNIIHGCAMDVTKTLACILENEDWS